MDKRSVEGLADIGLSLEALSNGDKCVFHIQVDNPSDDFGSSNLRMEIAVDSEGDDVNYGVFLSDWGDTWKVKTGPGPFAAELDFLVPPDSWNLIFIAQAFAPGITNLRAVAKVTSDSVPDSENNVASVRVSLAATQEDRRDVVPTGSGEWAVTQPGKGVISSHSTQEAAEQAAKDELRGIGGQVYIHRPDGIIRDADTVPPARDPFPPRDKRH